MEFKTEKVTDRISRIFGFNTELMYLVEGRQKAALLDTGSGFRSLKACTDRLLNGKPLLVLLTHGHTDHAMGAGEFFSVYMNHEDDPVFKAHGGEAFRREAMRMSPKYASFTDFDYIPTADCGVFKDLKPGDVFDLGGINVEMFGCPGHTRGSLCMLIREERTLLLGDACNGLTFLFDEYSTSVAEYRESLVKLDSSTKGAYDKVLLSHIGGKPSLDLIQSNIAVCEDILAGRVDDQPFEFMGRKAKLAKAFTFEKGRLDGGSGNIVYSGLKK